MTTGEPFNPGHEVSERHHRAGKLGGETTKQRYGESGFYRDIGARGGTSTMQRHGGEYEEYRRRGGQRTKALYGAEHYHTIASKSAKSKQARIRLRNEAMAALLADGWKIPTLIKLTIDDLPRLQRYLDGPLGAYLAQRPEGLNRELFVSQSGKPLSLANTYTVIHRFQAGGDEVED